MKLQTHFKAANNINNTACSICHIPCMGSNYNSCQAWCDAQDFCKNAVY